MTTNKQYLITNPLTLTHDISWYTIPKKAPSAYQHRLSNRLDAWYNQALVLNLVAQGFSLETEIKPIVARKANCGEYSVYRAIKRLDESGILHRTKLDIQLGSEVVSFQGRGKMTFSQLRLNRRGRGLCRCLAHIDERWHPRETEWERTHRIHEQGKREPEHTLGTLVFAYQARLRGWKAGVMPNFREGRFVPDAVVEKDGEEFFVEVELHYGKGAKWRNMHNALSYIAFCGRSPQHEKTLREECGKVGSLIKSTNLTRLITGEERLWA